PSTGGNHRAAGACSLSTPSAADCQTGGTMADAAALGFDPMDPAFLADPYPVYDALRREAPVLFDERSNHWLISRHRDVGALLRDRRFGRNYRRVATHEEMGRSEEPEWQRPFWDVVRN